MKNGPLLWVRFLSDEYWNTSNDIPAVWLKFLTEQINIIRIDVSRIEEIEEDTIYFMLETGLENRMNISHWLNPTDYSPVDFWMNVTNQTISQLVQVYRYTSQRCFD